MNYRILRATHLSHYKDAIDAVYRQHPDFDQLSYREKQQAIYGQGACYSNGFSTAMEELGNEAHEIVFDFQSLQHTWARENEFQPRTAEWQAEILMAQIEKLRPDALYLQGSSPVGLAGQDLKTRFPFLKVIAAYSGYPSVGAFQNIIGIDVLFACTPKIRDFYRGEGYNARLLYHGFNSAILKSLPESPPPQHEFLFAGSSGFGYGMGHRTRYWLLVELLRDTSLNAWLFEPQAAAPPKAAPVLDRFRAILARRLGKMSDSGLTRLATVLVQDCTPEGLSLFSRVLEHLRLRPTERTPVEASRIPLVPLSELFPGHCHPPVFGMAMYRLLQGAKVVLNVHTDAAAGEVGNMRLFEATGIGSCLLTDTGSNLSELFEDGVEVVAYSSPAECREKARFLFEHDQIRQQIAQAGQRRTLRDHSLSQRSALIHQEITSYLRKRQ
ncbi:MAG: glycosyltransferase family 1 protein [Chitinivibrionia bacterium]|nr:glycosyltransferase family 1 protein [Chitinivibrionia bacterium]